MVGRSGAEQVAERLGKPASDTVVGGWGAADGRPGEEPGEPSRKEGNFDAGGRGCTGPMNAEGAGNPKRGAGRREAHGGDSGKAVKED